MSHPIRDARLTPGALAVAHVWGLVQWNFCVDFEVVWKSLHSIKAKRITAIGDTIVTSEYDRLFPYCRAVFGHPRPALPYFVVPPGVPIAPGNQTRH